MCRLLGLAANRAVDCEFSLGRFQELASSNPDGWGIGWYESGTARVHKEPVPADDPESGYSTYSKEVRSNIIIAHVRRGTVGARSRLNSHPFQYQNWLFAHNGSVRREYLLFLLKDEYKERIHGETDSEVYFYWILQSIEEAGDVVEGIRRAIAEVIKEYHAGLNFLLSSGSALYAFRYTKGLHAYYSLYKLERDPLDPGPLEFFSPETRMLLHSKSLKGERAVLVCSEKLTKDENWAEVSFGNLVEIDSDLSVREIQIL